MEKEKVKLRCYSCQRYFSDKENIQCILEQGFCVECFNFLLDIEKEQQENRVSRDMAIDAGMPEIEGWKI